MFRRLNSSKTIHLACPYCGHVQEEPSRVISSVCRECGEHFKVKKGVAQRSNSLRVSGITEASKSGESDIIERPFTWKAPDQDDAATIDDETWMVTAESDTTAPRSLDPIGDEDESPTGISAGAFFGFSNEDDSSDSTVSDSIESQIPDAADDGKMPPNFVNPKKRRKLVEPVADFEVRCYRCYHVDKVSRFAKSTQCERCSSYISLANYEVKSHKNHTLRTRGDISITRRGGLKNCEIACHHLTVSGAINAYVDCSGDAVFRHSGVVRGQLFCRKILIERGCEVEFPDGLMTDRADIQGTLFGNLTCSGNVKVSRTGEVRGDVHAVNVDVKNGGRITGDTVIDPETSTALPVKMGFNSSIIS